MNIPVCHISKYGMKCGTVLYNIEQNTFQDTNIVVNRNLPLQDYISCSIENNGICTVVGKVNDNYAICLGDNYIVLVNKERLLDFNVSNIKLAKNDKICCNDGKLNDLSHLFSNKNILFQKVAYNIDSASLGMAKKFFAKEYNKDCIVKFTKGNGKDIYNEYSYMQVADILNIPCCRVDLIRYSGKSCVVSMYAYDKDTDIFMSFRNKGNNPMQYLCDDDKVLLDKMLLLDFIMNQQDRHYSNLAFKNDRLYPLYDNGDCLGIGSIGIFSNRFREYIKGKSKEELLELLGMNPNKLLKEIQKSVKFYDKNMCLVIIKNNLMELFGV